MTSTSFSKYKLIAELGHGGMADVFLAVQAGPAGSGFSKLTVIKRLRANLAEDPEFVRMLVDEARIAARLNHPNVVQTNEVGESDGQYYIAMEYLDGQPLHRIQHRAQQRAKDGTAPPIPREVQYVILMDALAGLHHAHELTDYDGTPLDIVHRDMTPHNIFVTYEGQVKVVDFGIAKASGRASETRQGVVKGKVRYMAPEQAIGHDVDRRTDVFAAGIMLWEIALGRRMWRDKDDLRIVHELVGGQIQASPRELDPEVPEEIDRICRKALASNPADRHASADELRADIEQYLVDAGKLVEARRKLPQIVSELFKDRRSEIRGVIEKQLALLTERPSLKDMSTPIVQVDSSPSSVTAGSPFTVSLEPGRPSVTGPTSAEVSAPSISVITPPPPRHAARIAAIVIAVACIGGVLAWRAVRSNRAAAEPTVAAAVTQQINVRVTGAPESVHVRIDDGPAMRLPLEMKVEADGKDHKLLFEAEGHVAQEKLVKFERDVSMSVALVARAGKTETAIAEAKPPPTTQKGGAPVWYPPPKAKPSASAAAAPATTAAQAPPTPTDVAKPPGSGRPDKKPPGRLGIDPNMPW